MNSSLNRLLAVLVAVILAAPLAVPATAAAQEMSDQDKKMMEMMQKYGTPGKPHQLLMKYAGDWEVEIKTWRKPDTEPEISLGTMKNKIIFDGRFVKCNFEGMMGGMKAVGLEIIGYDLYQDKYVTFWIDGWSTSFALTTGTLDASGMVLTETGTYPDPMTAGKTVQKVKNVTKFMPKGGYKFEMFMIMPDGKEVKGMEIVTKRKMM